eukprot:CAMPEP_0115301710 /NCGR_PEP_ID=MMETSP0270-20121206/70001_1 /TAXON_ID=71861 /ORGANISM="Scrippsiella trochoidea, Strain CCMP3099" /LENGTH=119 /DNA_ID=CAMNT_0002719601 /DNA_START=498 /DNA_END=857 /DNA_ORIENTATION=-
MSGAKRRLQREAIAVPKACSCNATHAFVLCSHFWAACASMVQQLCMSSDGCNQWIPIAAICDGKDATAPRVAMNVNKCQWCSEASLFLEGSPQAPGLWRSVIVVVPVQIDTVKIRSCAA